MGLILDSSILIAAERKGKNARETLSGIGLHAAGEEVALSVVTVLELAHGIARSDSPARRSVRQRFLDELLEAVPVYPVSNAIALRAGRIDGENSSRGLRLALADLLIGVTALELGYRVATNNVRHFQMVPSLVIVSF